MRRFLPMTAVGIVLLMVAAGCGGGDDTSTPAPTTTPTTTPTPTTAAAGRSGEVLALSYNVAGLPEGLSGSQPGTFMPLIAPRLNDYELVLMQETWRTPDPNPLAPLRVYHEILEAGSEHEYRSEPKPLPLGSDASRPDALVSDGLNRFSDFPFEPVERVAWTECFGGIDQSDGGSGDCLSQKGFSVASTTFDEGVEVDVYNLHLEAGGTDEDQRISRADAEQLAAFVVEHSAGRPVIMGGDFNLHTDPAAEDDPDEAWDLESFSIILEQADLTDVCAALDCPEPGRIDKFLFRSSDDVVVEPLDWGFETDVFVSSAGEPLSDHEALAVRFAWTVSG